MVPPCPWNPYTSGISEAIYLDEGLAYMFYQRKFDTTAWGKMYHRSLFLMEFVILKVGYMRIYLLLIV